MDLYEISDQVVELLRKRGLLAYQSLKYQFRLDDEGLAALKEELFYAHPEIADDAGRGLVWTGSGSLDEAQRNPGKAPMVPDFIRATESRTSLIRHPPAPVTYTPVHLADRIRAVAVNDGERKTITALCRSQRVNSAD